MKFCQNDLHILPHFLVKLLSRRIIFGHNTPTPIHTNTYIKSVPQNCLDPDKDGFVKLNENEIL